MLLEIFLMINIVSIIQVKAICVTVDRHFLVSVITAHDFNINEPDLVYSSHTLTSHCVWYQWALSYTSTALGFPFHDHIWNCTGCV